MHRINLWLGKQRDAWLAYPEQRRAIETISPGPPVLVTGAHRSGTTWVGGMLAVPGLWHVHEPFNPNQGLWKESMSYARASERREEVDALCRDVMAGRCRRALNLPNTELSLMPLRWLPIKPRRILIKDPLACLLSEYLALRHGFETLVLFRHPAGFVGSVWRLRWPVKPLLTEFLKREDLMSDWLGRFEKTISTAMQKEGVEPHAALYGCIATVLNGFVSRTPCMRKLVFEELCEDPLERFRELHAALGLPYSAAIRQRHAELCFSGRSSSAAYHAHAILRQSRAMAARWKTELDAAQIYAVRSVWDEFELPLYRSNSDWSTEEANLPT